MNRLRLRPGLGQWMGMLLALFGVGVALCTGYYSYSQGRDALLRSTHGGAVTLAQDTSRRLAWFREDVVRDLLMLALNPEVQEVLARPTAVRQARLQDALRAMLSTQPWYLQLRLISASDFGLERVRVDRDVSGFAVIQGDDLEEKGHLPYVYEALRLMPQQVYLSRITINHERGSHQAQGRPTAVFSMPIHNAKGAPVGVAVINVDIQRVFDVLRSELPSGFDLILANGDGDYLIHPDSAKTFGFDKGRPMRLQDDLPEAKALVEGHVEQWLSPRALVSDGVTPEMLALVSGPIVVPSGERRLVLGVTRPLQPVLDQANELLWGTLRITAVVIAVCLVLAFVLSLWLIQPLEVIRQALVQYGKTGSIGPLPTERTDEVGALAQGVHALTQQITQQLLQLRDNQEELEHLAQHDMLTGLPNRRYLQDRLALALAQARRSGRHPALLFIDLDRFKEINDRFGHDAGDALLQALAERLRAVTRESDIVARMGGDEFVVLIDSPADKEHVAVMAQKLIDALHEPVPWHGNSLQVGASIGISRFPQDGTTVVDMMSNADRAMYRVKAAGRNAFVFFSD